MKKNILQVFFTLLLTIGVCAQNNPIVKNNNESKAKLSSKQLKKQAKEQRKKHAYHLSNNPINKNFLLSRSARKAEGLPPNQYYEQNWLMTIDPVTGVPTTENLEIIRTKLAKERNDMLALGRIPGDAADNMWIERGPNNVGGRTRAMIFDPSDATYNTVIAGGVSGGLWKNTNISSAASTWTRIATLPENLNVQVITIDPNSSSTWYVGTGESYVFGDVQGNGVWKTTNSGATWTRVFGGGVTTTTQNCIKNLEITAPSGVSVIGSYCNTIANFGPGITTTFSAPIELVNDGTAPTDDACEPLAAGSLTGKIALIRRGTCSFESKVVAAENAGAIGVIIMNNVANAPLVSMADSALGATLPAIFISKESGDLLVANLSNLTGTFKPTTGNDFIGNVVSNIQHINDIVVKNNGGNSDVYVALGDGLYSNARNNTLFSPTTYGLYKSTNGGTSWNKLTLPLSVQGSDTCPNDIELGADGTIWVSSTNSWTHRNGGGRVFSSTDNGNTFTLKHTVTGNGGGLRVELETSATNPNKIYILSELGQADSAVPATEVKLEVSTDALATAPSVVTLPVGNETRETTYGFTGAQAFYDLMIEADPSNDQIVYLGGIDLYRTSNGGASWTTISDWTVNVHSDQHGMVFKPNDTNVALFGNDGGVYYAGSLSTATELSSTAITSRNNGFNVTQFVGVAVMPNGVAGVSNDFIVAGAQDNGSQYFASSSTATAGASTAGTFSTIRIQGGDGGIPMFAQDSDKYYVTNYVYNDNMVFRNVGAATTRQLSDGTSNMGLFYPAMALDSNRDMVYSDFTNPSPTTYQIRRYSNIKSGTVTRTNLTNALLTSYPTALHVSKYTTASTTLYVGTMNGKLLKVTTANTTPAWSDITGPLFVGSISDVELGTSEQQIFVTMYNYGVTSIWYTSNGGTTWNSIEGNLPDLPVNCIQYNPLNTAEIMIGTDLGVWFANTFSSTSTAAQALNWRQSYNGMSNVRVNDLDLQPNSPTAPTAYNVYASTYGRGVFSGPLSATLLGLEKIEKSDKVLLYPNPSSGIVNISLKDYSGDVNVKIYDINGKLVYSEGLNSTKVINLQNLATGMYVLNLQGENLNHTEKIILK